MKKFMLLALVTVLFFACGKKNQFTLNGEIVPSTEGSVVIYGFEKGTPVATDTVALSNSKFKFKGEIGLPDIKLIGLAGTQQRYIGQVFVEKGTINVTIYPDSMQANVVTGSKSQDLFNQYEKEMIGFQKKENELRQRFAQAQMSGDQSEIENVRFEFETISNNANLFARNFVKEYNNSPVGAFVYLMHFYQQASVEELDSILQVFDKNLTGSQFVEMIRERADNIRSSSVGAIAPDFTLNDPNGNPVSLSSLRGKVVLIDFWASWCMPCMAELPNVIELYAAYKDKGLEIFGVSLDRNREAWVKTIEEKGMTWIHGWDLENGSQGEVAGKYAVEGIPYTVLVDKDGKIIATKLSGEALKEKLAELLGAV